MYHTSPEAITEIHAHGIAGDCLFFSNNVYQMSAADVIVYEADFDCIRVSQLYDAEIVAQIATRFGVDEDTAEALLDARENEWDHGADADDSWWLQGKRGECAVKMGHEGCEDLDEQGTVYIVPMTGKLDRLSVVEMAA